MAAPAFGTVGSVESSTGTAHNVPVPASVANGNIIVVAMFIDGSTVTVSTVPTGFAHAEGSPRTVNAGGTGNHSVNVMWKRASGADSGTYNFVISASAFAECNAVRYTGCVASGNPWDSPTNAADGGSTSSTTTPNVAITTQGPDRLNVFVGTNWGGGAWTPVSGWNERVDNANSLTVDDLVQAVAGSTGNVHATNASTAETGAWLGALIGTTVSAGRTAGPLVVGPANIPVPVPTALLFKAGAPAAAVSTTSTPNRLQLVTPVPAVVPVPGARLFGPGAPPVAASTTSTPNPLLLVTPVPTVTLVPPKALLFGPGAPPDTVVVGDPQMVRRYVAPIRRR